ncbi:MAG: hypothetical protein M1824_000984 [Vezdaea acicularis]|nr:MAG: hypothetical protein M1824_000984 [Vezdaea acicularis]
MTRTGSYSSQQSWQSPPAFSPRTPDLLRSDSWSSQRTQSTASPQTPISNLEPVTPVDVLSPRSGGTIYGDYYSSKTSALPELLPGRPLPAGPEPDAGKLAKKSHPCAFREKYNCTRTFTTSGHAARHAKIHTGEKETPCPECNKYFARMDNMKQHLKTHKKDGNGKSIGQATQDQKKSRAAKSASLSRTERNPPTVQTDMLSQAPESTERPQMYKANAYSYASSYSTTPVSPYASDSQRLHALASVCSDSR